MALHNLSMNWDKDNFFLKECDKKQQKKHEKKYSKFAFE